MPEHMKGTLYRAGTILGLAKLSHERIQRDSESQIAVILAAIAIESFLNDLAHMAESLSATGVSLTESTRALARLLKRVETGRGSTMLKLDLVYVSWGGLLPDRGAARSQETQLLFDLRNMLVHAKPEEIIWGQAAEATDTHKIVKQFVVRGVIEAPRHGAQGGWTHHLLVPSVSAWAVGTAQRIIRDIAEIAPADFIGVWLKSYAADLPPAPDDK